MISWKPFGEVCTSTKRNYKKYEGKKNIGIHNIFVTADHDEEKRKNIYEEANK